jgi:hypothetical protein
MALWLAAVPAPALGASVLSDASVTPTDGTTATPFTFTVRYFSDETPNRPAQSVWAQVGGVTVTLIKVSGTSHDGTWQATTTLPAGTHTVTFHATTAGDPQPAPISGPTLTVTEPPPTPAPPPPPPPTVAPPPTSPSTTAVMPAPPPATTPAHPGSEQLPASTGPPASASVGSGGEAAPASAGSAGATDSASADPTSGVSAFTDNASDREFRPESPQPVDAAASRDHRRPGSQLAALLIVGGAMSLGGSAVLARQWLVTRARPR